MKEIFIRLDRCLGCRSCEMACAVEHSRGKNRFSAPQERPLPRKRLYIELAEGQKVPLLCRHCDDAPCVAVCRTGATSKDPVTGIVTKDSEKCVGCWMCTMVCQSGVIGQLKERKVAVKCDQCPDQDVPSCVIACPTKTLIYAEEEEFAKIMRQDAARRLAKAHQGGV